MLKLRLASALVLIPVILGSVYYGGPVFFVAVTFALLVAGWEFFDMARRAGYRPSMLVGLALIAFIAWDTSSPNNALRPIVTIALIITLTIGLFRHGDGWLTGWAYTFAGVLYVGWLGSYFFLVRSLDDGRYWTTFALLVAWATDTGAYLAGTYLGKHGFFTSISPKKTWEGAIGGWLAAVVVAVALGALIDLPIMHSILFGFGLAVACTIGDLAESLFKRQTGVKDSSNMIPGHGGLLDRIDSLLFAAAFTYYYLIWILRV
ncbi:MAG: phosphatidate cytidylyltransferase [Chloroflexi bacterium]|nr:phosphatidate cytidylyltransferase [Chloroflexota bacterium]